MNAFDRSAWILVAAFVAAAPAVSAQEPTPKPAEPAPAPASPGQKPTEPQPAEQKPGEAKPGEAKPADGKSADGEGKVFQPSQLEQIVAPIALYPDTLLTQVLMASTYPLEIVQAARWQQKNAALKGDALDSALKGQDWDPTVKSLCSFPDVLKKMNENLDWTQDLGEAFLGQKEQLMTTIQTMRQKAMDAGQLKTNEQQSVTKSEDKYIVIQSTSPEVVYVPTYSPTVVYGGWSYPSYYYPPMYVGPPPGTGFMAFSFGVALGACWGDCNWGGSDVDIDIDNYNNFIDKTEINPGDKKLGDRSGERTGDRAGTNNRAGTSDRAGASNRAGTSDRAGNKSGKTSWNHDASHRKGVNYKNPAAAQKVGASQGGRVSRDQARGYDRGGSTPSASQRAGGTQRPSASTGGGSAANRASSASGRTPSGSSAGSNSRAGGAGGSSGAFSGSRSSSLDRAGSTRGASSRGGGGGGSRGGGGRGGGGGGRRR